MRIYIDEAGGFVVPGGRQHSFSLVLALAIPTSAEAELFYEFLRLRDSWPKQVVEIKGSSLNESQAAQVIDLLCRYDSFVDYVALDMSTHGSQVVDDFRIRQAAAVTANLTPAHHPRLVTQLQNLARTIRDMPNQLFLQAFLTIHLILEVIEEATLYFVQRQPKELGEIAWVIDRKDRTTTQMEETWAILILPMSESHFVKTPLKTLLGADYSHFDGHYGFTAETVDSEMARHLGWMEAVHGVKRLAVNKRGIDAKLLLTEHLEFADSLDSLGLQLADMLASILRRALNNHLQLRGWKDFGRLLVRKGQAGSSFLQLGPDDTPIPLPEPATTEYPAIPCCGPTKLSLPGIHLFQDVAVNIFGN